MCGNFEKRKTSCKFINEIMSKFDNIYKEKFQLGAYYTYDKDNKKVYDIKGITQDFKELIKTLK